MNEPGWKPWLSPEQHSELGAFNPNDLKSMDVMTGTDLIDERNMKREKEEEDPNEHHD